MKVSEYIKKLSNPGQIVGMYDVRAIYGTQLYTTKRGPLIGNRIFKTYDQMEAYVHDKLAADGLIVEYGDEKAIKSAIPGLVLSVTEDPDESKNTVYEVKNYNRNSDPKDGNGLIVEPICKKSKLLWEIID